MREMPIVSWAFTRQSLIKIMPYRLSYKKSQKQSSKQSNKTKATPLPEIIKSKLCMITCIASDYFYEKEKTKKQPGVVFHV